MAETGKKIRYGRWLIFPCFLIVASFPAAYYAINRYGPDLVRGDRHDLYITLALAALAAADLLIFIFFVSFLSRPFNRISSAIGSTPFGSPISLKKRGAAGAIAASFVTLVENYLYVLGETRELSRTLRQFLDTISSSTLDFSDEVGKQATSLEEISSAIEEISAGIDNIQYDFDNLASFTTRITELSSIVDTVHGQISDTAVVTHDISAKSTSGTEIMSQMSENMSMISDSSKKMTAIVGIINDISDQINLLSLNASIEAARAGESGRGFAVVADEISKLADRTATSIKEIESLIARNNSQIQNAMRNVDLTVDMIRTITTGVDSIHNMMTDISGNIEKQASINKVLETESHNVEKKIKEIDHATKEQKKSIREITISISAISDSTQACSSKSEDIANSIVEAANIASTLNGRLEQN